ncbi:polyhydroxyalkanoate synthesis repressor PhaR [Amylibacter kogurei]|uniref:Polyhydroxyalkanoate synthesis repressor PhaR n=1 Tax=Paramylibacter kogurei TaxID=1889778 RepID=A0A2G5K3G2_9RHOB|nr:polyhydroxyalkanoate synthesis repressor PhaR [Amylibacter kogurei]PIB23543.1 polyhydroxyalkanoate synthesis repressor PhaR [Amylibacter kogurei]
MTSDKMKNETHSDSTDSQDQTEKPVVIKKYSNRRLYNTADSKYIVQQDVIDLINEGVNFKVEDAKSGEDITRAILNQIIFEQETQHQEFLFPLEFQKQLIRMYNDTYRHMIPGFLTQSINYFTQERSQMSQAWQQMMTHNAGAFVKQSQDMAKQNMEMFRKTWDVFGLMKSAEENAEPDAEPTKGDRDDALEQMQKQIDALQSQIKSIK